MIKNLLRSLLKNVGYEIRKYPRCIDPAVEKEFKELYGKLEMKSGQSWQRFYSLYKALIHITENNIPGDIVECGVYKGASLVVAGHVLKALNDTRRKIYLYDTFEGMLEAGSHDVLVGSGKDAKEMLSEMGMEKWGDWCRGDLDEVQKNVWKTGYPKDQFVFVKGKVEDTIPKTIPGKIALLRVDVDWLEPTYHALTHLFPRLCRNGVLILDDYGHWEGAKKAVDRYFTENKTGMMLHRIDYSGRIGIKTNE